MAYVPVEREERFPFGRREPHFNQLDAGPTTAVLPPVNGSSGGLSSWSLPKLFLFYVAAGVTVWYVTRKLDKR